MTIPAEIAVVVTTYQQRAFLAEALTSVFAQGLRPTEIVVVDDGSDEPVDDVVAAFPGVVLHRQANQGVTAARNAGLAATSAPYVVFLDADDRLLPDALARGADSLAEHPDAPFTSGASHLITSEGRALPGVLTAQPRPTSDLYLELLRRPYICPPSTALFRRDAIARAGAWQAGPDLWGVEDWEFYLRLAHVAPPACHGAVVAQYRMHAGQSSRQVTRMISSSARLLDREAALAAGDSGRRRAVRAGQRYTRAHFGWQAAQADLHASRSPRTRFGAAVAFARVMPFRLRERIAQARYPVAATRG